MDLIREKLEQARKIVAGSDLDAWCIFVRETSECSDPILPFFVQGAMTWLSAFLIFKSGKAIAVVGNYDADPLKASGHWDEIATYVQGIRETLLEVLNRELPGGGTIGVNSSVNDSKADGITHGMYTLLAGYLEGSSFKLTTAEPVCGAVRAQKTPSEIARIRGAIAETELLFAQVPEWC